ncbi:MAG TPA: class I SAM-dependent DNA methyltransferase [Thermoguttaceae bacterium]|nr:class I SAM-dependent DNA methyltransferase [Thermoguttaceae bacterium]
MSDVVQKLWGFCHTLRHEGIDYGDYVEQLTYLLFLKMADERHIDLSKMSMESLDGKKIKLDCSWPTLSSKSGTDLTSYYVEVLRALGQQTAILGDIFAGSQSRFRNPVNLKQLLSTIDETDWTALDVDVKAEAFEGLLDRAAREGKKGAGQLFTPRILICSIVRCMKPDPRAHKEFTVCDPACGTGGFLVAAYDWFIDETGGAMRRELAKRLKTQTYYGQDLVPRPRRLALMNLYLHGLDPHIALGDSIYEEPDKRKHNCVLTNPPFGTRGANQAPARHDFTISTSNKQLNFLQHVMSILKPGGRTAVVVPDNCLFADQAGEVFKVLTEDCDVHTVLRLPNGTFAAYSPGTKTNVVFFTKGYPTEKTWIYDCRTNVPRVTKKDRPLTPEHFAEFEKCFGKDPNGRSRRRKDTSKEDRWRGFDLRELRERDFKIDSLKWLSGDSGDNGNELQPDELATDAIAELEAAVQELNAILAVLENGNSNDGVASMGMRK